MPNFKLTVKRTGFEDRVKPYTYEAAAITGFHQAVKRHERLASDIILVREDEFGTASFEGEEYKGETIELFDTPVLEWHRQGPEQPRFIISFVGGLTLEEKEALAALITHPEKHNDLIKYAELVPAYGDDGSEVYSPKDRADAMMDDVLLLTDTWLGLPALLLPNGISTSGDTEVGVYIVLAYQKRFGRLPFIIEGFDTESFDPEVIQFRLVDLNEAVK
jgi:hypothetical protein